jgi:hypothetical protein
MRSIEFGTHHCNFEIGISQFQDTQKMFRGAGTPTKHHGQSAEKFIARSAQKFVLSLEPKRARGSG